MQMTPAEVRAQREWVRERGPVVVGLCNHVRENLGTAFDTDVSQIDEPTYQRAVDEVFADGDLAVNVATLVALLRDLDVEGDYPGFVVDELLGRELAAMIGGHQPHRLLAEATFHYADTLLQGESTDPAGADDCDAALAAGFQTRLPGWPWCDGESPFSITDT